MHTHGKLKLLFIFFGWLELFSGLGWVCENRSKWHLPDSPVSSAAYFGAEQITPLSFILVSSHLADV